MAALAAGVGASLAALTPLQARILAAARGGQRPCSASSGRAALWARQAAPKRRRQRRPVWAPCSAGHAAADSEKCGAEMVVSQRGKLVALPPELADRLAPLAEQCGVSGKEADLARAVARLDGSRQQGVVQHGAAVAAHLTGLGIEQGQLGRLLLRCPLLFSWPVEQRAGVLFGQLMALGLTAAQAARCLHQQPIAARSPSFAPAIAVLSPLLAAGCRASDVSKTGEQLLGELLVGQPAAVQLLRYRTETLQQRIGSLLQLNLTERQLVAALRSNWSMLNCAPEHLAALEVALQQELGADRELWCKVLRCAPLVNRLSEDRLRQVVLALVAEFGKEEALRMVSAAPQLLTVRTAVWRRALVVWGLCGVADPRAVAVNCADNLNHDWLRLSFHANLVALQRYLPWQPSAAEVIERYANYVSHYASERLAGRLLFLEQASLLPLLVADKHAALQEWRLEEGLHVNKKTAGEPLLISVRDVGYPNDTAFEQQLEQLGVHSGSWVAFRGSLEQLPAWQQLMAAAEAEAARLQGLLPPEVSPE